MAEWTVASGFLSEETRYRLVIDGPYDSTAVCRLIELLTIQKGWLEESRTRRSRTRILVGHA